MRHAVLEAACAFGEIRVQRRAKGRVKRRSGWIAIAALVAGLVSGCGGDEPVATPFPDVIRASIEKGIAWQLEQQMLRTDAILASSWIAEAVAAQLPEPAAKLRARSIERYQQRWPDELVLRKLIGGKQDLPDDKTVFDRHRDGILARLADGTIGHSGDGPQDFLLVSLYANDPYVRGNFDRVFDALFERPLPRYGVTHQLLALHFLQREKAFPEAKIQAAIDRYVEPVAESVDHDLVVGVYTDLMAERMAFLALVDRVDLLKPAWLQFSIANQRANGQWEVEPSSVSPAGLGRDMDQHITVLSLYALSRFLAHIDPKP